MSQFRILCTLAVAITASRAGAAEKWADERLPVTSGLELWFDVSRIAASGRKLEAGGKLESWPDASGNGGTLNQASANARPVLVKAGDSWVVRFDGQDDHLRLTSLGRSADALTVFLVVAPHSNPGNFCGFCAANGKYQRDYETGFTIDQGTFAPQTFSKLNLEGRGFVGAANLMRSSSTFGTLQVVECVVDPKSKTARLAVDGKPAGTRPFAPATLSLDEFTLGARYYTNGPGAQQVRGWIAADIAEVLVYGRVLTDAESVKVRDYLNSKHAELKKLLPGTLPSSGGTPLQ